MVTPRTDQPLHEPTSGRGLAGYIDPLPIKVSKSRRPPLKEIPTTPGFSPLRPRASGLVWKQNSDKVSKLIPGVLDNRKMSDNLKDMNQVNTREIQQHTRSVRERLERGETLQWTIRGHVVAHLTPATRNPGASEWPDPLERLHSIYGRTDPCVEVSASEQIYRDRG